MKMLTRVQYDQEKVVRLKQRATKTVEKIVGLLAHVKRLRALSEKEPTLTYDEHEQLEAAERSLTYRHQALTDETADPASIDHVLRMTDLVLKNSTEEIDLIAKRLDARAACSLLLADS